MTRDEIDSWIVRIVPVVWLAVTFAWAVVIVVTDRPAWEPALWIAATLGPLASLDWVGR